MQFIALFSATVEYVFIMRLWMQKVIKIKSTNALRYEEIPVCLYA